MSEDTNVNKSEQKDIEDNKAMGVVAYILFFVPLLAAKDSKFATYHANQGLILLILAVIIYVASEVIPLLGWLVIGPFGSLFCLVLLIIGVINAAKGEMKQLPLIGNFEIIKANK